MTSIASASVLVNRLSGGNNGKPECFHWWKDGTGFTPAVGAWQSTWLMEGSPGPGVAPTTPVNPDRTTAGAFRHLNPTGGRQRWLRSLFASAYSSCRILIYDRLLHMGGLSGTVTTAQTVGGTLSRYTGAASLGNFAMAEVYTAIGASFPTATINYVDPSGTTRTSPAMSFGGGFARNPGNAAILPFDVSVGANGVQSVTDFTLAGTTGTAGNFGITICRPLYEINIGSADISSFGHGTRALALEDIELATDACLGVMFQPTIANMFYLRGNYVSVEA